MSKTTSAAGQPGKKPKKDEELIFTPISIARARHASIHGPSILDKSKTDPAKKEQKSSPSKAEGGGHTAAGGASLFKGPNGCLVATFLITAFVVGGVLGGMVGGGLLLWANTSGAMVFAQDTPTPTSTPSPTPVPAETSTPTPTPEPQPTQAIEDIIAGVIPSVVTVINQHHNNFTTLDEGRVVGSGVIIDGRGYIATNNHVVDTPQDLTVILFDGREVAAELVAANPAEDLAILKIDLTDLPVINWGDSSHVRPGQMVYAIGSPLGDFPSSVSFGIVSGLNRGSSGGPLINFEGEVIGINTFIIRESQERGIAEGIAFAIPAETAKNLLIPWIAAHTGESVPIPAAGETE